MGTFETRYFGSGSIDQRYCSEMLKWVIVDVRRSTSNLSRPATLEINKRGLQLCVHDFTPKIREGSVIEQSQSHSRCQLHSHSVSELEKPVDRKLTTVQEIRIEFSRVHRFVQFNASRCEFCLLVRPVIGSVRQNGAHGRLKGEGNLITCYVFEAASSADLAVIAGTFSESHRRMSEPSKEGTQVDNLDMLMQMGSSFFEVAYVGRAGITTHAVPQDRVDQLVTGLIRRRYRSYSELLGPDQKSSSTGEKVQLGGVVGGMSTMMLEIADTFLCLINTVTKCVVFNRELRNIAYVFQGHAEQYSHYVGLVVRDSRPPPAPPSLTTCSCITNGSTEPTPTPLTPTPVTPTATQSHSPFYAYLLECSEKAVADECINTIRQAFEATRNKNPDSYRCPECPVSLLNSIVQRIDRLLVSHFQLDNGGTPESSSTSAVQSHLANLIEAVGWWTSFDVHRLSALVQESLMSYAGNTSLLVSLQAALRNERAQATLADAVLAIKSVLDAAQRSHSHATNETLQREASFVRSVSNGNAASLASSAKLTRSSTQVDHNYGSEDDHDAGKQSWKGITGIFDKFKIFGKEGLNANGSGLPKDADPTEEQTKIAGAGQSSSPGGVPITIPPRPNRQPLSKSPLAATVDKVPQKNDSSVTRRSSLGVMSRPQIGQLNELPETLKGSEDSAVKGKSSDRVSPQSQGANPAPEVSRRGRLGKKAAFGVASSLRLSIYNRVVDPDSGATSDEENEVSKASGQSESVHSKAREARDRWRKVIWNVIIKRRTEMQQERHQASNEGRLQYDDVSQTATAYTDWLAVLARPKDKCSLEDLRRLVTAGVPKALRGRIWIYLIEQQKARREAEEQEESANSVSENVSRSSSLSVSSSVSGSVPAPAPAPAPTPAPTSASVRRKKSEKRKQARVQRLKSVILEKDNLNENDWSKGSVEFEEVSRSYELLLGKLANREVQRAIMLDLGRTFPQYPYFSNGQGVGQLSLFNLLKAYSLLDPEVGYCQGLGFIAGVLLLHLSEHEAFYVLCFLMKEMNFREMYLPNMLGLQIQEYQLEHLLVDENPALHGHLTHHGVAPTLYASSWFLTLFSAGFPFGVTTRVFDFLLCDGSMEVVLRTALLLLTETSELLMSFKSIETIADCFKETLPKIAPLLIDRITAKMYDQSFGDRMRDYELEFCITKELQNEMRARVKELERKIVRLHRLLQRADQLLPSDKAEVQSLRSLIQEELSQIDF